jgi:hypothetical protein
MEIPIDTLSNLFQILGEIKGALVEIRKQNERISQLELWQARLKAACTVLAGVCVGLCRGIYGR